MSNTDDLLRAWVETVEDYAIILLDSAGNIASWNSGAERLLGYSEEEALGRPSSIIYTPEDVEAGVPERELGGALSAGRAEDERWHARKDGTRFWGSGLLHVLRSEDGAPRGFVKVFRDLTEQRMMEDALRQRTDELLELDHRRSDFLAMLAHELRNPLSPILNSVFVLEHQLGSEDPIVSSATRTIQRQVASLKRMIDDLLDVSRVAKDKLVLEKRPTVLDEVLNNAVQDVRSLIDERRHELTLALEPIAGVLVDADPIRLQQIFINLLTNAARYTWPEGKIRLFGEREDHEIVVRVRDSGVGLSPELGEKIFDLFTQADHSMTRTQGGLGIGLALVKNLVELHGGTVSVESEGPGEGCEFIVRLPVIGEAKDLAPSFPTEAAQPVKKSRRILIVEDDADSAQSLALLLRFDGNDAQVARDGPSALETARALKPDVVVLDIGLPGMSGYEVAAILRRESDAKLIAITGYEDEARAKDAGFHYYLVKPVERAELAALLDSMDDGQATAPDADA